MLLLHLGKISNLILFHILLLNCFFRFLNLILPLFFCYLLLLRLLWLIYPYIYLFLNILLRSSSLNINYLISTLFCSWLSWLYSFSWILSNWSLTLINWNINNSSIFMVIFLKWLRLSKTWLELFLVVRTIDTSVRILSLWRFNFWFHTCKRLILSLFLRRR